jgi:hypothetical protein
MIVAQIPVAVLAECERKRAKHERNDREDNFIGAVCSHRTA